jgi:hypothetical protein
MSSMNVVITEWAFQSYLDLKHRKVFTKAEYKNTLRPNAELLKDGWPSSHAEFNNSRFWGPCTDRSGNTIQHGFKMKWRQIGSGNVQLRLLVALLNGKAYMCESYVKTNDNLDKRMMAKMKNRIRDITKGTFQQRGLL